MRLVCLDSASLAGRARWLSVSSRPAAPRVCRRAPDGGGLLTLLSYAWCAAQSQGLAFLAKTDNARQIANILSSLHVKKDIVRAPGPARGVQGRTGMHFERQPCRVHHSLASRGNREMPDALQEAYVVAESSGLRFTVQKHNCLQMHVYLKRELFNVLECDAKHEFGINLTLLLECLNIFQT